MNEQEIQAINVLKVVVSKMVGRYEDHMTARQALQIIENKLKGGKDAKRKTGPTDKRSDKDKPEDKGTESTEGEEQVGDTSSTEDKQP